MSSAENTIRQNKLVYYTYSGDQKLFENMAIVDIESICGQEEKFRDTDATTWIGKHVPLSASISTNLIKQPSFLCNSNPAALVESFVDALDGLATQSKTQIEVKFLEIETSVKTKPNQIFFTLNQRRCRKEPVLEFEDACTEEQEQDVSTQFLQTQKNQFVDLEDHSERYCNVLPVFGFNITEYDIISKKSFLLLLLDNKRGIEPIVIKKANQFVSFKFGDVQLPDKLNFLGGAMSLVSVLKAFRTSKTRCYFPNEWFDHPENLNNTQLPPYGTFFSKLHNNNPHGKNFSDFQIIIDWGLTSNEALSKYKWKQPPATRQKTINT